MKKNRVLSWMHFGDLHMTQSGEQNHRDFAALVFAANRGLKGAVDFALLPGDNADDGTAEQFQLVADIANRLELPLHVLPGDHDFQQRTLDGFYRFLAREALPCSIMLKEHRCLFLDVVSKGTGGPDFRLDALQLAWLEKELKGAEVAGESSVIFMHTYPADLQEGSTALTRLLKRYRVVLVDMGHTHYNELSNAGHTIYATTRSTGQIEEGNVGFSTVAIDERVVSWRFKPLSMPWPWVQITTPADHRLITAPNSSQQVIRGAFAVRAKVWGDRPIEEMHFQFADAMSGSMTRSPDEASLWEAQVTDLETVPDGLASLTVQGRDVGGNLAEETLRVQVSRTGTIAFQERRADGSDGDSLGAWPEKGILGSQLGPNRNGRHW